MKLTFAVVVFSLLLSACSSVLTDITDSVKELWRIQPGFQSPESVIYDAKRDRLYVSNVNGYEKNGRGFLSALTLDGELIDLHWVSGLNGPTGMAIWQDNLYVADIDHLVIIDLNSGEIRQKLPTPDLHPGLNDVTVDNAGNLYVSGSFSRTLYQLVDQQLVPFLRDAELRDANGLYAEDDYVMFTGFYLRRIDVGSRRAENLGLDTQLTDLESIESDGQGGYFISTIGERPIWHMSPSGTASPMLERQTFSADLEFVAEQDILLVPSGDNRLFAFRVNL